MGARTLEAQILLSGRDSTGPAYASAARQAKSFQATMQSVARGMMIAGAAMTVGVTLPLLALAKGSIDAFSKEQAALAGVKATLQSMGPVAHRSLTQLRQQADELGQSTTLTRTQLMQTQSVLLTFGHIHGKVFDAAMKAVTDYTAHQKMIGQDIEPAEAARLWGRALQEPVRGMMALHRAGIFLSPIQERVIKQLLASGAAGAGAKAQMILLGELQKRFGGSMAEFMRTQAGQIEMAKKAWEELKVSIGAVIAPTLLPILRTLRVALDAFGKLPTPMKRMIVVAAAVLAALGPVMFIVGSSISVIAKFGGVIARLATAGFWTALRAQIVSLATTFGILDGAAAPWLAIAIAIAGAALLIWKFWQPLKALFIGFADGFSAALQPVIEALSPVWAIFRGLGRALRDLVAPIELSKDQFEALKTVGRAVGNVVGTTLRLMLLPFTMLVRWTRMLAGALDTVVEFVFPIRYLVDHFRDFRDTVGGLFRLIEGSPVWRSFVATWKELRDVFSRIWNTLHDLVQAFSDLFGVTGDDKKAKDSKRNLDTLRTALKDLQPIVDAISVPLKLLGGYIHVIAWEADKAERAIRALTETLKAFRGKGDLSNIPRILGGQAPKPVVPKPSPNVWDPRYWFDSSGEKFKHDRAGRAATSREFFKARGWKDFQAAAITGNLLWESGGLNARAVGDGRTAFGLAQWHRARAAEFARVMHKSLVGSTMQDQLAFVNYELTQGGEKRAGAALRHARSLQEATAIVSRLYERPAVPAASDAQRLANARFALNATPSRAHPAPIVRVAPHPAPIVRVAQQAPGFWHGLAEMIGITAAKASPRPHAVVVHERPRPSVAVRETASAQRDRERHAAAQPPHRVEIGKGEIEIRLRPDGTPSRIRHKPPQNVKIKTGVDTAGQVVRGGSAPNGSGW